MGDVLQIEGADAQTGTRQQGVPPCAQRPGVVRREGSGVAAERWRWRGTAAVRGERRRSLAAGSGWIWAAAGW